MKRKNKEDSASQRDLHTGLITSYSFEELKTVCFHIGVDFDNLPGDGKEAKARELLLHLERRHKLPELIEYCSQDRPNFPWDAVEIVTAQATSPVSFVSSMRTPHRRPSSRQTKLGRIEAAITTKIARWTKTWFTLFIVWLVVQVVTVLVCIVILLPIEGLTFFLVVISPIGIATIVRNYIAFRMRSTDGFNYLTRAERSKIILSLKHHFDGDSWLEWFTRVCIGSFLDYDKRKQRP